MAEKKPAAKPKQVVAAPPKKVVQAEPALSQTPQGGTFKVSAEGKSKATSLRIIAALFWAVAIGLEMFVIFWLLEKTELNLYMVWLIGSIVVIGGLALAGSMFWKKANRFDPASEKDKVRFFVQNQLGAIITIVAFLPLIILIFMNDKMTQGQKTLAGVIGIVVMLATGAASADWAPPSIEQRSEQGSIVMAYTGSDQVYWVKGGSVYHLCNQYPEGSTIPALARGGEDNDVIAGTIDQAMEAGKTRLSYYGYSECGLTEGSPDFPQYLPDSGQAASEDPTDEPT
ncbi:MAG: hypothetical protein LBG99_04905 [Propionibacteriaceae bacterium]|nr:hypothetical protein [Propionibacteriaceae bacterium]